MSHDPIRVVVLPTLRLPQELLERAFRARSGIELVEVPRGDGELDGSELERLVEESGAQFVVAGFRGWELPRSCRELLEAQARRIRVIALEANEGEAVLFELRPQQRSLGPVSPDDVVEAIYAAANPAPLRQDGI